MKNALKKELSILSGLSALAAVRVKSPLWTGLFTASAVTLFLSSLQKNFKFYGKNVYITGGSRGLGLSLAWNLLQQGAHVVLVARDEEELKRARDILLMDFPLAKIYLSVCDVTDSNQLSDSLASTIERMGGIDLLVNNAGSILVGPFTSMQREDFEAQMKIHLYAVVEATMMLLPHFKNRGGGRILNICSLGGKVAVPHMLPYDTSKFALAGYSQGISSELSSHNIVVTTAYPTVMRTGSPIQAVFKGDHEAEFVWFKTIDNLPLLSMSADRAAKKILNAVAAGSSEVVLSIPAKAKVLLGTFFPEIMNLVMGFAARLLPQENSALRKTGADSSRSFRSKLLLKGVQRKAEKTEAMYNQEPHHDANFNLGLN